MSWKVKEEHADLSLKRHYIVLEESLTGEQHHVAIYLGHDACPTCGHVTPKTETGEIDLKMILEEEIAGLEQSAQQTLAHAVKHRVTIKTAVKK